MEALAVCNVRLALCFRGDDNVLRAERAAQQDAISIRPHAAAVKHTTRARAPKHGGRIARGARHGGFRDFGFSSRAAYTGDMITCQRAGPSRLKIVIPQNHF